MITKSSFREFASNLQPGETLDVSFVGGVLRRRTGVTVPSARSGSYVFRGVRTGRGKGGSLLIRVEDRDGAELTFGTPEISSIVGIRHDRGLLGYASESDMPSSHPARPEVAARLKQIAMSIIPLSSDRPAPSVSITSSSPTLNGSFTIIEARRHVGRHGQVSLRLQRASGEVAELWTYRDSGVVSGMTISS